MAKNNLWLKEMISLKKISQNDNILGNRGMNCEHKNEFMDRFGNSKLSISTGIGWSGNSK